MRVAGRNRAQSLTSTWHKAAAEKAVYSDVQESIEHFPSVLHKGLTIRPDTDVQRADRGPNELLDYSRWASRVNEHVH